MASAIQADLERKFGPEHDKALMNRYAAARLWIEGGRLGKAEKELRGLLSIQERVRGSDDRETLLTRLLLASCLKMPEALAMARRAQEGLQKAAGVSSEAILAAKKVVDELEKEEADAK